MDRRDDRFANVDVADLPGDLRALSDRLGARGRDVVEEIEERRRARSAMRRAQRRLFLLALALVAVESVAGFAIFGWPYLGDHAPKIADNAARAGNWMGLVLTAYTFGLIGLLTTVILGANVGTRHRQGRTQTAKAADVVLGTDVAQSASARGRVAYLAEVAYVFEVGGNKYRGTYRPRSVPHRVPRKLEATAAAYPPGKVVEV